MFERITVLMPVYNGEKFLKDAIDSILAQTYTNFDFLIIDDGSTDESAAIINLYHDKRIRYIKNEKNIGLVETLNKGIELADTELIARMDADDVSYPARLQKQVAFFKANPECALLATWARILDETNEVPIIEHLKPEYYRYNLNFECWIYHSTVMYKRQVVRNVGKYISRYSEDFDLWWRISIEHQFDVIPEVLLDYRTTESSLSRVVKKKEYEDSHIQLMIRNISFYIKEPIHLENYEAQFLITDLEPVLARGTASLITCFRKLDYITDCIKEKEQLNKKFIAEAALYKKKRILFKLKQYLSKLEIIRLLVRLKYWSLLFLYFKQIVYKKISKFQ